MVREEIKKATYNDIWQAFGIVTRKTVGVKGDKRTYHGQGLRCVSSEDGMTADWSKIPVDFREDF